MDRTQRSARYYVVEYQRQYRVVKLTEEERIAFGLDRLQIGPPQSTREEAESLKRVFEYVTVTRTNLSTVVN